MLSGTCMYEKHSDYAVSNALCFVMFCIEQYGMYGVVSMVLFVWYLL